MLLACFFSGQGEAYICTSNDDPLGRCFCAIYKEAELFYSTADSLVPGQTKAKWCNHSPTCTQSKQSFIVARTRRARFSVFLLPRSRSQVSDSIASTTLRGERSGDRGGELLGQGGGGDRGLKRTLKVQLRTPCLTSRSRRRRGCSAIIAGSFPTDTHHRQQQQQQVKEQRTDAPQERGAHHQQQQHKAKTNELTLPARER